jgi:peroxiredoxin
MNKILRTILFLLILPIIAVAEAIPGKVAPEFSLRGVDGKEYKLSDQKGSLVVLEWTNPECPFVKKHYDSQNMQGLQKKFTALGVKWFSINSSAHGRQGNLSTEQGIKLLQDKAASPTSLLLDPSGTVGTMYGAKTTPHMYVINKEGIVVYVGAIDDNDSTDVDAVANSKNYVAQALDELLAGQPVSTPVTNPYGCSVKY